MKRLLPFSAAVLVAALTLAAGASAQVPSLPLPTPPAGSNAASSTIFDAMLSIARAAGTNPAAAQQAAFSYNAAIQQYNAGDLARARSSALMAISQTGGPPMAQATAMPPPPIPQQVYMPMPNVVSADQADAEGWVALARRAQNTCGAPGAQPPALAQQQYAAAVNDLVAQKLDAAKSSSQVTIDQCATAAQAYAQHVQAAPTPAALGSYAPEPIATLGPDPALLQAPQPAVMPSTTPSPAAHHGFRL